MPMRVMERFLTSSIINKSMAPKVRRPWGRLVACHGRLAAVSPPNTGMNADCARYTYMNARRLESRLAGHRPAPRKDEWRGRVESPAADESPGQRGSERGL